ncbi:MAG TPA: HEAT repeat domain-containing protein, partial [Gemmata sp.]|nr:HEAT repeat domain-containing protein [Gemmata sp.]
YAGIGLVGKLPPEEATKYAADLGELASHKEELIRQRAGIVLEKLGPAAAPAAAALGAAIPQEENGGLRDQFIDALIAMGPAAKEALPTLLKLAAEESAPLAQRQRLISAIVAAAPDSKEVAAVLVKTADDPDQDVRASAATAMAKLNPMPADALAKLVSLAKNDRGTYVRIAAYRSLAVLGPRAAAVKSDVEALAKGKYPEFVLLAKVALASIGGDAAKAAADVRAGLTDRHPQVRAAAIGSLYFIGPAAADLPAISRFLKDRDPTSREFAVKCLAKIGPAAKEAVPQLIKMLDDAEVLVRLAAIDVLGNLGLAAMPAVEKLKQLRGTDMAANPQLSPAARKALEKLGVGGRK